MKCHLYTGEGLLVGWADVRSPNLLSSEISGPFYPNDFYLLIHPTMRLFRWPHDVPIGEFQGTSKDQDWREICQAMEEIGELHLTLKIAETGQPLEASCTCIEENGDGHILHGLMNSRDRLP